MTPTTAPAAPSQPRANRSRRQEAPAPPPPADVAVSPPVADASPSRGATRSKNAARSANVSRPPTVIPATATPPPETPKPRATKPTRKQRLQALGRRMRDVLSVLSAVGILAAAGVAGREGHQWLVTTPRFNAREITVSGLGRTTRDEVLRAAGLVGDRNVLSIDCERTARDIEGLPWVSRARVTRRLPGMVTIAVEERAAVATVSAGSMYLVGSDGTLFKRVAPGDPADLPVVTGIDRMAFEQDASGAREEVRDALALLGDVEASAVGATLRIDEVHREPTGDLSIVAEGAHVWLGRGPYRAKLTRLRVVLRELDRRGLHASEIHLETDRHPERVTVRVATPGAATTAAVTSG